MTKTETWKPIPGYEGLYECSDRGQVRSLDRQVRAKGGSTKLSPGMVLSQGRSTTGYYSVSLCKAGVIRQYGVHRLVLLTFVGPPPGRADACHNNGRRTDNRLVNLRWDTHNKNMRDKIKHGTQPRGETHGCSKLNESQVREILALGKNLYQHQIAEKFGVSQTAIWRILRGKTWQHLA
jgi:hypothetical protein